MSNFPFLLRYMLVSFAASILWKSKVRITTKYWDFFSCQVCKDSLITLQSQNSFTFHFMAYILCIFTVWPYFKMLDSFYSITFRVLMKAKTLWPLLMVDSQNKFLSEFYILQSYASLLASSVQKYKYISCKMEFPKDR